MKYNATKDPIRIYNELLGGKWRLLIIYQLFQKTQRFKDLTYHIQGITPRMLTKELRVLEKYNLVEKEVYREVPPRVEYSLSDEGVKLYPLIEYIIRFGEQFSYLTIDDEESLVEKSKIKNIKLKSVVEEKSLNEESVSEEIEQPNFINQTSPSELDELNSTKEQSPHVETSENEKSDLSKIKKETKVKTSPHVQAIQLELF